MRHFFFSAILMTLFLASCSGPTPAPATAMASSPEAAATPTVIPHAPEIRFALVGEPTDVNVWSLFDDSGASYANYVLRSNLYPSLYRLSIPDRKFGSYLADGTPSVVTTDGVFYVSTVKLKSGLKWSDGSPITAQDVAFTVTTALNYRLGLDWESVYNPNILDHAEAVDNSTVRFFFKSPFTVGDWEYGALQGPIVSQSFWESKLADADNLLPKTDLIDSMAQTQVDANQLQADINEWDAQLLKLDPTSKDYSDLNLKIGKNQDQLNSLDTKLGKLTDEYNADLSAARAALFALKDDGEPTFGPFLRAAQSGNTLMSKVDSAYPFEKPNYDQVVYQIFSDEKSAMAALQGGDVNAVLNQNGLSSGTDTQSVVTSSTSSARFLVFNQKRVELADPVLHRALDCVIDRQTLVDNSLQKKAAPLDSFVLPANTSWLNPDAHSLCSGMDMGSRLQKTVDMLKAAGYSWTHEPTIDQPGKGLALPGGVAFPSITLLAPTKDMDPLRAAAADYIEKQAQLLGIPLTEQLTDSESIHYAVYSSGDYDMAILGWRLSEYPGYLCGWFQLPSPFMYNGDKLKSACEAMNSTADLATSQKSAFDVQTVLMSDLPFIPLYEDVMYDAYRNVRYPFQTVLDGISGLYGAPSLAIPSR